MALKWVHLKLKSRLAWSIATETNKKVFLYCLPFSWHLHPRVNTLYYKVSVLHGFLRTQNLELTSYGRPMQFPFACKEMKCQKFKVNEEGKLVHDL